MSQSRSLTGESVSRERNESTRKKLREALEKEHADKVGTYDNLYMAVRDDEYEVPAPENRNFVVAHFGTYVATGKHLLPGEYCIAEFNLLDGLIECHSGLLDPGEIPTGYYADAKDAMKRYGYPEPGSQDEKTRSDVREKCVKQITELIAKNQPVSENGNAVGPVSVYTMPDYIEELNRCLMTLTKRKGDFKVKSFIDLFEVVLAETDRLVCDKGAIRSIHTSNKYETLVFFRHIDYKHGAEAACEYHTQDDTAEKMHQCSTYLVKTWVFNMLEHICPLYGIEPVPGKHFPEPLPVPVVVEDSGSTLVDETSVEMENLDIAQSKRERLDSFLSESSKAESKSCGPPVGAGSYTDRSEISGVHSGSFVQAVGREVRKQPVDPLKLVPGLGRGRAQDEVKAVEQKENYRRYRMDMNEYLFPKAVGRGRANPFQYKLPAKVGLQKDTRREGLGEENRSEGDGLGLPSGSEDRAGCSFEFEPNYGAGAANSDNVPGGDENASAISLTNTYKTYNDAASSCSGSVSSAHTLCAIDSDTESEHSLAGAAAGRGRGRGDGGYRK